MTLMFKEPLRRLDQLTFLFLRQVISLLSRHSYGHSNYILTTLRDEATRVHAILRITRSDGIGSAPNYGYGSGPRTSAHAHHLFNHAHRRQPACSLSGVNLHRSAAVWDAWHVLCPEVRGVLFSVVVNVLV